MIIVYCIDSINGIGGIQHVTVKKANALAEIKNNEVWILYADHSGIRYFSVSPKVHTVDLDINYYKDDWISRWNVLKGIFIKRRLHKKHIIKQLLQIHPDVVISVGQSEKYFLPFIHGPWITIREFHFGRNYRLQQANTCFDRVLAHCGNFFDHFVLNKYDGIVSLTREDKIENWHQWNKVHVIPNLISPSPASSSLESKRILAVGRLTYQKNFSSLIRAFSYVNKRFPEWTLDIIGEGDERPSLSSEILDLGLSSSVRLMGIRSDIQRLMLDYSLFALSSRFEGFAIVLGEAFSCGLPVVSYACPYGPKDFIRDGIDGYLVPPGDEKMLAERICQLIENNTLRKQMGRAALERSKDYSIEKIIPQWISLFDELMAKRKK
jgi:glycosyltransferase involved in cell wall biosynthesis